MLASKIMSHGFLPILSKDTGEHALTMMNLYHVKHIPVVDVTNLIGLISEEEVLDQDPTQQIASYNIVRSQGHVYGGDHIFDIMKKFSDLELTCLAVIDKHDQYMGMITLEAVMAYFADSYSFEEPGSILVISSTKANYSLSEIAQIIESEDAVILSSFISNSAQSENMVDITIKVTSQEIQRIISALERYEYQLTATFSEEVYESNLKDRYDSLMTYLNV